MYNHVLLLWWNFSWEYFFLFNWNRIFWINVFPKNTVTEQKNIIISGFCVGVFIFPPFHWYCSFSNLKKVRRKKMSIDYSMIYWLFRLFYFPEENLTLLWRRTFAGEGQQNLSLCLALLKGLWAGKCLKQATPAVTRDLVFFLICSHSNDCPIKSPHGDTDDLFKPGFSRVLIIYKWGAKSPFLSTLTASP
jgi:hypothetical protein